MKIKINYFTSTGNTLWTANRIKENFERYNHEVSMYDSTICGEECYEDCDMVGFVYPVWGSTMPNPQRDILEKMKNGRGTKVFFIGNAGIFSGDTGIYYKKIADRKGYDTVYACHIFLPINIVFPGFSLFKQPDIDKKNKMVRIAEKRLEDICSDINNNIRKYQGRGIIAAIGGRGQRNHYNPFVDRFKKKMYIDKEKCIECGLCYKICPVGAIEESKVDNHFAINHEKCIFCLKCYNLCPKDCVLIGALSSNTKNYKRYKGLGKSFKPIQYR